MIGRAKQAVLDRIWANFEPRMYAAVLGHQVRVDPDHLLVRTPPHMAHPRVIETAPGDGPPVVIGRYASIHDHSYVFLGGMHDPAAVGMFHFRRGMGLGAPLEHPRSNGPVVFGSDVWVAFDAVVMSGVTVGDGAIVMARAVVTRDVEPFEIVGGVPARHVGWRFDEPVRDALMRIRWWDWPPDIVAARVDELQSRDVQGFIARYDPGPGTTPR